MRPRPSTQPLIPVTPQTRSSQLPAAAVRPDGWVRIPREDVFTAQATATMALFGSNPIVQFAAADGGAVVTEVGMVLVPGISTSSAIAAAFTGAKEKGARQAELDVTTNELLPDRAIERFRRIAPFKDKSEVEVHRDRGNEPGRPAGRGRGRRRRSC